MEELQWINAREMNMQKPSIEPPIDHIISDIVGFKVYTTDPRILKVVIKFKRKLNKGDEGVTSVAQPDNFLENPQFIKEIREAFTKSL